MLGLNKKMINETNIDALCFKIEASASLDSNEKQSICFILRDWNRQKRARAQGGKVSKPTTSAENGKKGGRPPSPDANPKRRERYLANKVKKSE